jgi:putative ABC transport system substrate-binding protein
MTRNLIPLSLAFLLLLSCAPAEKPLYTIGVFQVNDAPTLNAVREGFIKALADAGFTDGQNIRLIQKNAGGNIPLLQRIAQEYAAEGVDMIVPLSTPALQAALHASSRVPIVFSSVANPALAGAGESPREHLSYVTGVSSRGPIRESLVFIREVFPEAVHIGTLWTPSELNSEYYLDLANDAARELGFTINAVPIGNAGEIMPAAQILVNRHIDVIYQISDNTLNAAFGTVAQVANENRIPLFGGFLLSTESGACAALGWDFFAMGERTGRIALRIKAGEPPSGIPIEYMSEVKLHINTEAAAKQGVSFPEEILRRAAKLDGGGISSDSLF